MIEFVDNNESQLKETEEINDSVNQYNKFKRSKS